MTEQILPFDDEHQCPSCSVPGGEPVRHDRPVLIVFGAAPQWPCGGEEMQDTGEHLCLRCRVCGRSWMETIPAPLSYAGASPASEENDVAIRKTGQATGQVTEVEQDGITREAARDDWDGRDDRALAAENEAADRDPDRDDD